MTSAYISAGPRVAKETENMTLWLNSETLAQAERRGRSLVPQHFLASQGKWAGATVDKVSLCLDDNDFTFLKIVS